MDIPTRRDAAQRVGRRFRQRCSEIRIDGWSALPHTSPLLLRRPLCCSYTEKALDRGEQLDSIEQKSDVLLEDANKFQHSAAATKRMFCRRHWRNVLIIAVLASVRINRRWRQMDSGGRMAGGPVR